MDPSDSRFTKEQKHLLRAVIDNWYTYWRVFMTSDGSPHRLADAKEQLKEVISHLVRDEVVTCEHSGISFDRQGKIVIGGHYDN